MRLNWFPHRGAHESLLLHGGVVIKDHLLSGLKRRASKPKGESPYQPEHKNGKPDELDKM